VPFRSLSRTGHWLATDRLWGHSQDFSCARSSGISAPAIFAPERDLRCSAKLRTSSHKHMNCLPRKVPYDIVPELEEVKEDSQIRMSYSSPAASGYAGVQPPILPQQQTNALRSCQRTPSRIRPSPTPVQPNPKPRVWTLSTPSFASILIHNAVKRSSASGTKVFLCCGLSVDPVTPSTSALTGARRRLRPNERHSVTEKIEEDMTRTSPHNGPCSEIL
jgi:hypothetical protein